MTGYWIVCPFFLPDLSSQAPGASRSLHPPFSTTCSSRLHRFWRCRGLNNQTSDVRAGIHLCRMYVCLRARVYASHKSAHDDTQKCITVMMLLADSDYNFRSQQHCGMQMGRRRLLRVRVRINPTDMWFKRLRVPEPRLSLPRRYVCCFPL